MPALEIVAEQDPAVQPLKVTLGGGLATNEFHSAIVAKGTMMGSGFAGEFVIVQVLEIVTFSGTGPVIAVATLLFGIY